MAPCRSQYIVEEVVMLVVAVMILLAGAAQQAAAECPGPAKEFVYPFAGRCGVRGAAWYYSYGEEVYELGVTSLVGTVAGYLAPEWDENNSTFYVRSAEVGAKYALARSAEEVGAKDAFAHRHTREGRGHVVAQSDNVVIFNSETGRLLGWRQEGEDEWFLVEVDVNSTAADNTTVSNTTVYVADFQFSGVWFSSFILCRYVDPPITCDAYRILNFGTSLGLNPYREDGVTYFVLSDVSNSTLSSGFEQNSFLLLSNGTSVNHGRHHHHHHLRTTAGAAQAM